MASAHCRAHIKRRNRFPARPVPGVDHGTVNIVRLGFLGWWEQRLNSGPQNWKQYAVTLLVFNTVLFAFGYLILALQP